MIAPVRRWRPSPQAIAAAAVTVAFIAFSGWWLLVDHRIPGGGDAGRQLSTALFAANLLEDGDFGGLMELGPNGAFFYPPLVHWIGAIPVALGLSPVDFGTFALNLVFVPLLAAGCFGSAGSYTARLAGPARRASSPSERRWC